MDATDARDNLVFSRIRKTRLVPSGRLLHSLWKDTLPWFIPLQNTGKYKNWYSPPHHWEHEATQDFSRSIFLSNRLEKGFLVTIGSSTLEKSSFDQTLQCLISAVQHSILHFDLIIAWNQSLCPILQHRSAMHWNFAKNGFGTKRDSSLGWQPHFTSVTLPSIFFIILAIIIDMSCRHKYTARHFIVPVVAYSIVFNLPKFFELTATCPEPMVPLNRYERALLEIYHANQWFYNCLGSSLHTFGGENHFSRGSFLALPNTSRLWPRPYEESSSQSCFARFRCLDFEILNIDFENLTTGGVMVNQGCTIRRFDLEIIGFWEPYNGLWDDGPVLRYLDVLILKC